MYSTGNYIQYPVINHNGQELKKKKSVYMYITELLCYTAEIGTTLQINHTSIKIFLIKTMEILVNCPFRKSFFLMTLWPQSSLP